MVTETMQSLDATAVVVESAIVTGITSRPLEQMQLHLATSSSLEVEPKQLINSQATKNALTFSL